jgi:DNA-binding NarL/FixJ family response regulator
MTVLIVDDHPLFREGLREVLRGLGEDSRIVAENDAEAALETAKTLDLDLVLIDLTLPGMNGIEALERFGQEAPGVPVVIISAHEDTDEVRRALALGALGYIPKSTPPSVLLDALRLVLGGGIYVPPLLLREIRHVRPTYEGRSESGEPPASDRLTERQIEVLTLLVQGKSNKLIARELKLSDKTVKGHVTAIFRALDVVNRTQAAMEARRRGLIGSEIPE